MTNALTRTETLAGRTRQQAVWLLPLLAVIVTWVCMSHPIDPFRAISGEYIDLEVYRLGVEQWRAGGDLYGHLPETGADISLPFIYPPFAALALGIYALLPWAASVITYLVVSIGALAMTLFLVAWQVWPRQDQRKLALVVTATATPLSLLLEPIWSTLDFGQVNLILMGLVAADCLTRSPRWPRGALLGIAAAIKLTPAAFVLFFLIRKDYKAAATAAISGAIATVIGFAVMPDESVRYWFGGFGNVGGLSGSEFQTNQSIQAVLARFEVTGTAATALWLVAAVALVAVAVAAIRRTGTPPMIALAVNAVVALLVSPISWSHHWVWVAPALLAMIGYATTRPWSQVRGWYAAAAATMVVFVLAKHNDLPGNEGRELDWSAWEKVIGNGYVWFSLLLVVLYAAAGRRQRALPRPAPTGSAESLVSVRER
ncbi:glycosyltransferase 87 family protein [Nocardia jinanensis]|uniref:Membrane protein n=1 Tax=Nocardia jinanensis TaxID=382504 RepID=A0A917RX75_9NOCA|nr:glycosyltransferase 87 family protein [Nocardia jinanensis]GGL43611.1 membrane protein [Nocardia jinanensis]